MILRTLKAIRLVVHGILCLFLLACFINIGMNLPINLVERNSGGIPRDVIQEYNYIKSMLDKSDSKKKTFTDGLSNFMGSEWPIMTYSLASYGMRNLAITYPDLKEEASGYIQKAIERTKRPEYYNFIVEHYGNPFHSDEIKDNAFYLGHFTLMLALYREVSGDDQYDELFHKFAYGFYVNFKESPTVCLTSYPGLTWTSEQVVPFRALKVHDDVFGTNYSEVIHKWKRIMEQRFIPAETGLLVTTIDKDSGFIYQGERAIPNEWTILFLHDILPDFTKKLYLNMKRELMVYRFGFPMFKEWVGDKQHATGDTGPIVFDVSPVSTAFGIASAAVMGDHAVYQPTRYLSDAIAVGVTFGNKRKYLLGGQIGTAAMFFVKTMELLSRNQTRIVPLQSIISIFAYIMAIVLINLLWLSWIIKKSQQINLFYIKNIMQFVERRTGLMKPEFVKTINKKFAFIAVACGSVGMVLCLPYLMLDNWIIVGAAGIVFLGGAVLYAAGSISMAILLK
ncbi:hypothetical protein ACFL1E_05860 [Candidatus Omnitrophota bacterium]